LNQCRILQCTVYTKNKKFDISYILFIIEIKEKQKTMYSNRKATVFIIDNDFNINYISSSDTIILIVSKLIISKSKILYEA